jgi:hypothetical protein
MIIAKIGQSGCRHNRGLLPKSKNEPPRWLKRQPVYQLSGAAVDNTNPLMERFGLPE